MKLETQTQHTPGPWGRDSRWPGCIVSQHALPGALSLVRVAELRYVTTQDFDLMLAAPEIAAERDRLRAINGELLAALQGLFEHCAMIHKHWGDRDNSKAADDAQQAARAAIAKARP